MAFPFFNFSIRLRKTLAAISVGLALIVTMQGVAVAQPAPNVLTAEQAALEVRVLKRALLALHPALTKYQSEAEWQAALARFEARGNAARTAGEMFLAASELAAAIRCGHTWTNPLNQSGAIKAQLDGAADKLPFTMKWVEGRWLVLASADAAIAAGDEVLAVNGIAAPDMLKRIWPYLRADGASDEKRFRQLGHDRLDQSQMDLTWPLLNPPVDGRYRVHVRRDGNAARDVVVQATTLAARKTALAQQGVVPMTSTWSLTIEKHHAVMRLPTFSFYNGRFDWKTWLSTSFEALNRETVPHLVIDIRDLEGGDGAVGGVILSHLLKAPHRYVSNQGVTAYERVPYVLARYLDTWDFVFFDRTGKVEPITSGPQAGKLLFKPRMLGERVIMPVANPYKGRVTLLVGGENSSAGYQFARLMQEAGAALLVGQPTGGNLRGLNGGELTWVTLPHSGVAVDIPLLAGMYASDTPDRSVVPDIWIKRSFAAQRAGVDEEMAAALNQPAFRNSQSSVPALSQGHHVGVVPSGMQVDSDQDEIARGIEMTAQDLQAGP